MNIKIEIMTDARVLSARTIFLNPSLLMLETNLNRKSKSHQVMNDAETEGDGGIDIVRYLSLFRKYAIREYTIFNLYCQRIV